MLTKSLLKTRDFAHFPCLMEKQKEGRATWNKICAYYKDKKLIKNNLGSLNDMLEALKLTKQANLHKFINRFIWLMNCMDWFQEKVVAL